MGAVNWSLHRGVNFVLESQQRCSYATRDASEDLELFLFFFFLSYFFICIKEGKSRMITVISDYNTLYVHVNVKQHQGRPANSVGQACDS